MHVHHLSFTSFARPFHRLRRCWRAVLFGVAVGTLLPAAVPAQEADLILTGGRIVTVDATNTVAEAMAIRGEEILRVGPEEEVLETRTGETNVVDLEGKTVLPGLIDSHTHAAWASIAELDHRIPEIQSIDDILAYVRDRAEATPEGDWIVVQQIFLTRIEERRYPSREELDSAAPNHPVFFRTGPDASLNSMALEHFGIDAAYQAPEGSKVERTADGVPTGILREWKGMVEMPDTGTEPTREQYVRQLKKLVQDYNSVGFTSFADRRTTDDLLPVYQDLYASGELTARIALSRYVPEGAPIDSIRRKIASIAKEPLTTSGDSMLRTIGVKIYLDGGMLTGSAYMLEPWGTSDMYAIDDPSYRGLLFVEPEKLETMVRTAIAHDLQFTAHSVGSGAVHALMQAYRSIDAAMPTTAIRKTRPAVTHANFISDASVEIMDEVGVAADIQPPWLYKDGATLLSHFGDERMGIFQPLATLFEEGIIVGGGSDHMRKIGSFRAINPYNPFLGMWTTIVRQPEGLDRSIHPEESLSRMQALRMYTANNAYMLFQEEETGSLEAGKLADFIVIDRNILQCPVEEIKDIQVLKTYLGGELVYDRSAR
jgi:predicted amidohydrolase YtcJ